MADRISMLPNEILSHILSFVPTQDAIATSVLSKRWKGLWDLVPVLDFDEKSYLKNDRPSYHFREFVYSTILARNVKQPIRKFRVKCEASVDDLSDPDVDRWVDSVIQRGIQILDIDLPFPCSLKLSSSTTLVVLKLSGWYETCSSFELPSLKTLHLDGVCFFEPRYFLMFLSRFPNLENLETEDLVYLDYDPYGGAFKSLPKLVRANISDVDYLPIDKYTDDIPAFPNLTHLEFSFKSYDTFNWRLVFAMLQQCPKLQTLVLDVGKHSTEYYGPYCRYPAFVPHCLTSHLRKCVMVNFKGKGELLFVKYIMENSTCLQAMTLCSMPSLNKQAKLGIIRKLELGLRRSATCKLSFE